MDSKNSVTNPSNAASASQETAPQVRPPAHVHGPNCSHAHHDEHTKEVPFARSSPKVGRNDPCPCGSGKKLKKCCVKAD